jgi:hypothetical protein
MQRWMDETILFLITTYISYAHPTTAASPTHSFSSPYPWSPSFLPFLSFFILYWSIIYTIFLCLSLTLFLLYLFHSFSLFYSLILSFPLSLLDDMINQLEREERELINRLRKTQRLQEKVVGAHWVIDGEIINDNFGIYDMNILVRWVYYW